MAAKDDPRVMRILEACLVIYEKAGETYRVLATSANTVGLSVQWNNLARNMDNHTKYWKSVLEYVNRGHDLGLRDTPIRLLSRLEYLERKLGGVVAAARKGPDVGDAFMLGYIVEVYLVDAVIREVRKYISIQRITPYDHSHHLDQFLSAFSEQCGSNVLHDALLEGLRRMWNQNIQLGQMAERDRVSKIYSREGFKHVARILGNLAQRNKYSLAMLIISIDNIDELYTQHDLGRCDERVKMFCERIQGHLRTSDVMGRHDFGTFCVCLPQVNQQFIYHIAERILEAVSGVVGGGISLVVNIGGAYGPVQGDVEGHLDLTFKLATDCLGRVRRSRAQNALIESF